MAPNSVSLASLAVACAVTPMLTAVAAAGCGKDAPKTGFISSANTDTITSNGVEREYALYIPKDYNDDTSEQRAVIFDFHGRSGTPERQHNNSQYDSYTAGQAYILVYPKGLEGDEDKTAWQGANYAADGVNDLLFVSDLLDYIESEYCVDTNRVYASGKSNGGGFTDTLACSDVGDRFAAFAMAAAALYTDNSLDSCTKSRAILEVHGDNDSTIEPEGGSNSYGGTWPDILEWTGWWATRDGCTGAAAEKTVEESGDVYTHTSYSCAGYEDVVQHYADHKVGHCWPSSEANNDSGTGNGCSNKEFDYTPVVLAFFAKWTLESAP